MQTYEHIAYLLLHMLKTSEKARFRLSRKSLLAISGRDVIKSSNRRTRAMCSSAA